MSKVKVLVCVLCGSQAGQWLHPFLAKNLVEMAGDRRFEVQVEMMIDKIPVDFARNCAVKLARTREVNYLLMIDHDQSFELSPLDVLSEGLGKDVLIIPTMQSVDHARFARGDQPLYPNFRTIDNEAQREVDGNLFTVKYAGTGAIFIRQTVWSRLKGPWFQTIQCDNELREVYMGEDFYFAQLARDAGFKVWCHNRLMMHYKTTELSRIGGVLQLSAQMAEAAMKAGIPQPEGVTWNIRKGAQ